MAKCGKGCMPECEYFTTGGCISPFNCPYKIETGYINSATSVIGSYTQGKDDLNEPKIKKWFRSLVEEGKIQQEPMNYDAATLQIYIDHLEKENAALRERLEKSVELPCKVGDTLYEPFINRIREWIVDSIYVFSLGTNVNCERKDDYRWHDHFAIRKNYNDFEGRVYLTREAAEARLAELKGGGHE